MTKSGLIGELAVLNPRLVTKDVDCAVNMILKSMIQALVLGNRIKVRGFGTFALSYRPQRVGHNPKSGEKVQVPEKYVPHFKAGKALRDRIAAG